jgi:hypothetical protein
LGSFRRTIPSSSSGSRNIFCCLPVVHMA